MTTLAVVDAHALILAATSQRKLLGLRARRFFDSVERGRAAAYVPTIVLVEVGEAVRRGSVTFAAGYEQWVRALCSSGRYHAIDLDVPIVLRGQSLFMIPERGDRLVAATALELDVPVVSRDPDVARAPGIEVLW